MLHLAELLICTPTVTVVKTYEWITLCAFDTV
jgi:hypothetical protein